mmetsp:Transcript_50674/g.127105  ORF Transcript_50674/g.127105 Transcript_50674/m.127105 type:complete len:237 (+) Transcript_50674:369-1079(+)
MMSRMVEDPLPLVVLSGGGEGMVVVCEVELNGRGSGARPPAPPPTRLSRWLPLAELPLVDGLPATAAGMSEARRSRPRRISTLSVRVEGLLPSLSPDTTRPTLMRSRETPIWLSKLVKPAPPLPTADAPTTPEGSPRGPNTGDGLGVAVEPPLTPTPLACPWPPLSFLPLPPRPATSGRGNIVMPSRTVGSLPSALDAETCACVCWALPALALALAPALLKRVLPGLVDSMIPKIS